MFETILPDKLLLKLVESAKFQERARKLDALRLLRAMVVAAATGYGGRQADVMRLYFESGATRVVGGIVKAQSVWLTVECCPRLARGKVIQVTESSAVDATPGL